MATVSFVSVENFDTLSLAEASTILYDRLIPACEAKGVMLSSQGNHNERSGQFMPAYTVEKYNELKREHKLFDVARVQKAFASLDEIVRKRREYKTGSYSLKHIVEDYQGEYLANGDLIAAMLVKGYRARFGKRGEPMNLNCAFQVTVVVSREQAEEHGRPLAAARAAASAAAAAAAPAAAERAAPAPEASVPLAAAKKT